VGAQLGWLSRTLQSKMIKGRILIKYMFCLLIICLWEFVVKGSKLRSWVGPDTYFEGNLPSPRQGHEMVSTNDDLLYIFGGWGNSGENRSSHSLESTVSVVHIFGRS
jgi:hypothetical protein